MSSDAADASDGGALAATDALPLALTFSAIEARARCLRVCRAWRKGASEESLWRDLDARRVYAAYGEGGNAVLKERLLRGRAWSSVNLECCRRCDGAVLDAVDASRLVALNLNAAHACAPDAVARLLARCGRLETLGLYWHPRVEDGALVGLAAAEPPLARLNVSGCGRLGDAGLAALLKAAPTLEVLNLTRCPGLTDASLFRIADCLGSRLRILNCYADAGLGAYDALASCPNLEELDCTGSRRVTGAAIAAVAESAGERLTRCVLSWCVRVCDVAGLALAAKCPRLRVLSFHGSTLVSDAAIDALAASPASTALEALDVNGCARVTDYLRRDGVLAPRFPNVTTWTLHT